ncbi:hypothetical protein [Xanthocytophaga agilis]|uniref:Uncharacterized protein n=1 Tax=Xanthocytophaga agilis TaxID=3048010 RepID=A0AAE3R4C4_9BACT|nr:hypothetical protein [Xanthocytophaga agilis]MDJ1503391.1 hypothetical protein [Xanthocytophaga agilis]
MKPKDDEKSRREIPETIHSPEEIVKLLLNNVKKELGIQEDITLKDLNEILKEKRSQGNYEFFSRIVKGIW